MGMREDECMGGGKRAAKQNGDVVLRATTSLNMSKRQNRKSHQPRARVSSPKDILRLLYPSMVVVFTIYCVKNAKPNPSHRIQPCLRESLMYPCVQLKEGWSDTLVRCPTKHDKNVPRLNGRTCNQLYDGAFKYVQATTTGRETRP